MQVALFGATGRTGSRVLALALMRDWRVTALTRNPQKLTTRNPHLTVIAGDLADPNAMTLALHQADAVLIALGTGTDLQSTRILSQGTAHIIAAMQQANIKRVVCLLSGWLFYANVPAPFVDITHEHARQLTILENSALDWVAVCPPALIDRPARNAYTVTSGSLYRRGYLEIGVDDVAHFMLNAVVDNTFIHQKVGIAD